MLYTTQDDGVILRHEQRASTDGTDPDWETTVIHRGHQGPRGIAVGRFHEDLGDEQVAIFGYSGVVELLAQEEGGWHAHTIFRDRDKGHWLASIEIDARNETRELLASGYGGRIVLLSRPPIGSAKGAELRPGDAR